MQADAVVVTRLGKPFEIELRVSDSGYGLRSTTKTTVPAIVWQLGFRGPTCGLMFLEPGTTESPRDVFRWEQTLFVCERDGTDYMTLWRVGLLLRECRWVTDWFVQYTAFKVMERGLDTLRPDEVIAALEMVVGGRQTIERIRHLPVPNWLIERTIVEWSKDDYLAEPETMTRELRAGTVVWRDEFAQVGVLTPEEEDARATLWAELQPVYTPIFKQLQSILRMTFDDTIEMQNALIALSRAGVPQKHGCFITAVLAYVAGYRFGANILLHCSAIQGVNPWTLARGHDQEELWMLKQLAPWVAKRRRHNRTFDPAQITAMHQKLVGLMQEHFPYSSYAELEQYAQSLHANAHTTT